MKKRLFKTAAVFAAFVFILLTFSLPANAAVQTSSTFNMSYYTQGDYYLSDKVYFYDHSRRFSDSEKTEIRDMLETTASQIGFSIALYSGGADISDSRIEDIAFYGSRVLFQNSDTAGVVFLYIDLDGYEDACDHLYCYHDAFLYYPEDVFSGRQRTIIKAMQRYFPAGGEKIITSDIIKGLKEFCSQLNYYKQKGMDPEAYYQDDVNGGYVTVSGGTTKHVAMKPYTYWYVGLIVGIAIGAIVALIVSLSVKAKYKFKTSTSASVYTSREKMVMRQAEDTFIGTHTVRVKIESSSGGGGGGHAGGGFSGGGGTSVHR